MKTALPWRVWGLSALALFAVGMVGITALRKAPATSHSAPTPTREEDAVAQVEQPAVRAEPPVASPEAPQPTRVREVSFDDIKFEMKKEDPFERTMLTPKIEKLAGLKIRIRGYMRPSFQQSGITKFILVRDNMECCFGPGAYLFDCIVVDMTEGQSIDYTIRPISVEGTFSIDELIGPGKRHLAIYHMTGDKVK